MRRHFLPEFYLKGFTCDGLLWLYNRERKQIRPQTPHNTAIIGHYYSFENEKGEKDYSVEALLIGRQGGRFGHFDFHRKQVRDLNILAATESDTYVLG